MKFRKARASSAVETPSFDLLRAKVEFELGPPAVLAITSSTAEDGKEVTARGLAYSLAATGYATLYLDTCLTRRGLSLPPPQRLTFEEAGRQLTPDPGAGKLAVLNLGDLLMQRVTNQRHVISALEILRSKFDYVIINTEYGGSTAFAATVVNAADAVLVTVKTGRRESPEDARLSAALEHIGPRFLGVVAIDPAMMNDDPSTAAVADGTAEPHRGHLAHVEKELQRREMVEWPT
jgi:Mrp family chromosome partitioning ATPase